jgi:hypothetical protein
VDSDSNYLQYLADRGRKNTNMIKRFSVALVAIAVLSGCSKKSQETPPPAAKQPSSSVADMLNTPAPAPAAPDSPTSPDPAAAIPPDPGGPDVPAAVKAAVQKYVTNKKTSPRSWVDLTVEPGYLPSIPTGKDGKQLDFEKTMTKLHIKLL